MLLLKTNIKNRLTLIIITLISFMISSCATSSDIDVPQDLPAFDQQQIQSELTNISDWKISGVIGIKYNGKADSANYVWQQKGDDFYIKIYGPLGVGAVEINGDKNSVELTDSNGKKTKSANVESLLNQKLGWSVPVKGLIYWVKGIAQPNIQKQTKYNKQNLLENLQQDGWNIDYKDYKLINGKYPLPSKVFMTRDNITIKVIIKSWEV
jgi:outer membrane lipoprotein LolB